VSLIFPRLLDDDQQWLDAHEYWRQLVELVAGAAGINGEWKSWYPTTFADGVTPIPREDLAVYEARCEPLGRAVYINQRRPKSLDYKGDIAAWVKPNIRFADMPAVDELVINLVLTDENVALCRQLLENWMDPSISWEAMENLIERDLGAEL
jgi:hypothetical protein